MMNRRTVVRTITGILAFTLLLMAYATSAHAVLNTKGRFRLEIAGGGGKGLEEALLGYIVGTGEPVKISGGGGLGVNATVGYGLTSRFDIDITAGTQESVISNDVINGDASFTRQYLLYTLKFKIPLKTNNDLAPAQIKLGVGSSHYFAPEFDFNYTSLAGGPTEHRAVKYEDTTGYHVTAELEAIFSEEWSLVFSIRYYNVSYDAETYELNGADYPISALPEDFQELAGDGVDFYIGIGKYF